MPITQEELTEFVATEEGKSIFNNTAKELGFESADDIKGLKDNRDKILGSERILKNRITEMESKFGNYNEDEYNDYLKFKESGDYDPAAKGKISRLQKQLDDEIGITKNLRGSIDKNLIRTEITEALVKNNIDPKHTDLLMSAYTNKARVEEFDGHKSVIIADGKSDTIGLPVTEYFEKWIKTESGLNYLRKPENSGVKDVKNLSSNTQSTITRKDFNSLSVKEQGEAAMNKDIKIID